MGNIFMIENRYDEANTYFRSLIELSPKNPDGFFLLGMSFRQQKKYTDAMKNFEAALIRGPGDINVFVNLISTLIENNLLDDAFQRCEDTLKKTKGQPKSQAIIYDLMGRLYQTKNQAGEAEKAYKSAMISNPDYLPPYYSLAKIYFSENREDTAIAQYKAAIKNRDGMYREQPNMMLGIIFSIKKQWDLAQFHYRKALELNPNFAPAANNLAYLLAEQESNLDEALRFALKARKILPDDPRVADTLGWVYVKLGFYEQAIQSFSESIQRLPDYAAIHFHLGMAYYKKGDLRQAKTSLEHALYLDKNFSGAAQAAQILADI